MSHPSLTATSIRTRVFGLGEDLFDFIVENVPKADFRERAVLAVTSKIVSLSERAVIPRSEVGSKMDLVRAEADVFLSESAYGTALTIKHGILIPAAGIDESNAEGEYYILFPRDPYESARSLHERLCGHFGLKQFGLIITDSRTHPLRRGVTGIGLAHWGFEAARKLVGQEDLFGRKLAMTYVNTLDSLAVAAVYAMGEAAEATPLAWVSSPDLVFTESSSADEIRIPLEEDLYAPLLIKN